MTHLLVVSLLSAAGVVLSPAWLFAQVAPTPSPYAAMNDGRRSMTAERLRDGESIVLDGRLEEPAWSRAVPAADFIEQDPVLGGAPSEATEVRVVFNRDHLYMGVQCFDSEPDKLLGNTMKRDEFLSADDRFMWTIDTFLNQQTGYFFEMNPSGLMADALMGAGGGNAREWDGQWNARVRRSEIGWTLEIDIPFSTLNFDPNAPAWGINFQRTVRRKNEESVWTGHLRNQGLRRMSNAGLLLGLRDVGQGKGLDIRPFGTATMSESPGRAVPVPRDYGAAAGIDVFYSLTPSLRGTLTVNTDFAETEVDQRRVNLTQFPLFFPEKRTFFLDGATFFDFYLARSSNSTDSPVQPFFSRRIGLANGQPQRIDVGAKLTGQAGAQDIGFLYVRTADDDGVVGEDFATARVKRRIFRQSYVGGIFTSRSTRGTTTPDRFTGGVDFRLATSRFRERNNLELEGFVLRNSTPFADGDATAYGARLNYPNDVWDGRFAFATVPANHSPDVGFTPRVGFRQFAPSFKYSPRPQGHPWIRRLSFGGDVDLRTDMDGRWLTRQMDLTMVRVETHSQDTVEALVIPRYERLQANFGIYPGIVIPNGYANDFLRYRVSMTTANRRVLATTSSYERGTFFSGDRRELKVQLGVRPRPGVTLNAYVEWNRVRLVEGAFDTRLYRLVADTQFSPFVYLVNNVQFDSVTRVLGWQSRFRWILKPGNDLFVVYSHNWVDSALDHRYRTLDRSAATKFVYTFRF
ncbi:MAG: carbohydrate binding family 9 domain-containing protein [Vicinamibacterales bacterium]